MRSLSEIETISKRASRATGFSWGVSEEIGKSIRLLELFGLPGIKNLNNYLSEKSIKDFEDLKLIKTNNKSSKSLFCPIILGVSFLDQIKNLEKLEKLSFKSIAYPLLLLPFLSRSSEILGRKILFLFDNNQFILNFNVSIFSNIINKNYPSNAHQAQISFLENKDTFDETEWKNLYKLSEKTFVEETESLKETAAGAGLTDND